uniref:Ferredoxin-fold anticodon binding domain-containing protein n=1 Tax=Toxoplasma gondii COUG TaxID=1074873 RepID=A0A2G8XRJ7_TOXGO|nr:Ferredoxin-fold anticodon binding domain-containing protein [Toxoplasma gondii COUG]
MWPCWPSLFGEAGWPTSFRVPPVPFTSSASFRPARTHPRAAEVSPRAFVLLASLCAYAVDHRRASYEKFVSQPFAFLPMHLSSRPLPSPMRVSTRTSLLKCLHQSGVGSWYGSALARPASRNIASQMVSLREGQLSTTPDRCHTEPLHSRKLAYRQIVNSFPQKKNAVRAERTPACRFLSCQTQQKSGSCCSIQAPEAATQSYANEQAGGAKYSRPPHIPASVWEKLNRHLHRQADNPIGILKKQIDSFFLQENDALLKNENIWNEARSSLLFPSFLWHHARTSFEQPSESLDPILQESPIDHLGCSCGKTPESGASSLMSDSSQSSAFSSAPLSSSGAPVHASLKEATCDTGDCSGSPLFAPFQLFDDFSPFVTCRQNFDSLLVPLDHVSRLPSDTYYLDNSPHALAGKGTNSSTPADQEYNPNRVLLRTHSTAHQRDLIDAGVEAAVWTAEVIRRDEIDRLHYPVFHQTDGFRLFSGKQMRQLRREHALLLKAVTHFAGDSDAVRADTGDGKHTGRDEVAGRDELAAWIRKSPCLTPSNPFLDNPVMIHLQLTLERLLRHLLGPEVRMKWDYNTSFPFTAPSVELYVARDLTHSKSAGEGSGETDGGDSENWMEVLGAGEIRSELLEDKHKQSSRASADKKAHPVVASMGNSPLTDNSEHRYRGWAFGLGMERLCMHLFGVEDIRLFWSKDPRFSEQFADGRVRRFVPFSSMPPVYKDISFWVNEATDGTLKECRIVSVAAGTEPEQRRGGFSPSVKACRHTDAELLTSDATSKQEAHPKEIFNEMSFFEMCREAGGDLVESVKLVDSFIHPKTKRKSFCYRLTYRAIDRTLTHEEVNALQEEVYRRTGQMFDVDLR